MVGGVKGGIEPLVYKPVWEVYIYRIAIGRIIIPLYSCMHVCECKLGLCDGLVRL